MAITNVLRGMISGVVARVRVAQDPVAYARSLGVRVGEGVQFWGMTPTMFGSEPWLVTLGDFVYVASGVQFVTHDGGVLVLRHEAPDLEWTAPITIGDYVYIGLRSIILPGVTIGSRSIIGAGSIVTRSVPPNSVAAGVPARVIQSTDEYLVKLQNKSLRCGHLSALEKAEVLRTIYAPVEP